MPRHLPPLNALRAFEAAARHLSFTKAAEELHVTPAAISHQVKALEEQLGLPLFRRLTRGLALTDEGRFYLPRLTEAFDRLAEATAQVRPRGLTGTLTVSVLNSFATRWLLPRLTDFRMRYPDLDVAIHASAARVDFQRDDVDVGIRYGRGRWPGLRAELVLTDQTFPVCSPARLAGPPPLRDIADLRRQVLLHEGEARPDESWVTWEPWIERLGLTDMDWRRGPRFTDASMMMQACIDGLGVAIGRSSLIGQDLAAGRLVRPFPLSHPADYAYWLVCPAAWAERPKIRAFRNWLAEQAAAAAGSDVVPGTAMPGPALPAS